MDQGGAFGSAWNLAGATGYLKLDSTKVSYGEYWRWKPGPNFLILAACKLLGIRFAANLLVPATASVDQVDPFSQPRELVTVLEAPIRACQDKGYALCFYYTVRTLGNIIGLAAALQSGDGLSVALVLGGQSRDGLNREVHLGLVSRLRSGKIMGTGDRGSVFDPAPVMDPLRLPGRSYAELLNAHAGRVSSRRVEVVPVGDVPELIRKLEQVQIDHNRARGIYVPATSNDVARVTLRLGLGPGQEPGQEPRPPW